MFFAFLNNFIILVASIHQQFDAVTELVTFIRLSLAKLFLMVVYNLIYLQRMIIVYNYVIQITQGTVLHFVAPL